MQLKKRLKRVLAAVGLLRVALWLRDIARRLRFLPRNWRYILHGAPDGLPLPPLRLVNLATGQPDFHWLLEGGSAAAQSIMEVLRRNGVELEKAGSLLDFGCGCGRVLRQWRSLENVEVHGTDYNLALVEWCRRNLRFASVSANSPAPPLPYAESAFDLVYALSVFTHFPEELQLPWIAELRRITRPGGHILITTHGERYLESLSADEQSRFRAGKLVVKYGDVAFTNTCGAYHPQPYVREELGRGLICIDFIPEGAKGNPHQDLYLFQKR